MTYDDRVEAQIAQYAPDIGLALPSIERYWKEKHLEPRYKAVYPDISSHIHFYAKHFAECIERTGCADIVSLGCGDGEVEMGVAQSLRQAGVDFRFHLLELSPIRLARAEERAREVDVADSVVLAETDLNKWNARQHFAGIMAHHSLHHILDLEHVFSTAKSALHPEGVFCTYDMIGRNGHMRWPEVLTVVEHLWPMLPERKRYNQQLKRLEIEYVNWDCAHDGFEGIRAQDILKLLIEIFKFEKFFAWGGLIDPFVDHAFGSNFDENDPLDCAFIDFIQFLNELLIDVGYMKPTSMCAVMSPQAAQSPKIYKNWSPVFCVRSQ